MSSQKSLGALLILISLLLVSMSFGHEHMGELMAAELTISKSSYEVTPGSTIVVNFDFFETFGARDYCVEIEGNGVFVTTGRIPLAYNEIYSGSLSFTAPTTPGIYTYYTHTYMYATHPKTGAETKVEFASDELPITITVAELEILTYTLTVNTIDENSIPLPDAEVSINTGVIGTTDSSGTVTKSDLTIGPWTVTATKEGYNSDSDSVSMTADKTVTLQLVPIEGEPTPEPTGEPTEWPTGEPTPIATLPNGEPSIPTDPLLTPVKYKFVVEMLDNSIPQEPIPDVKIMINGRTHYSDLKGKVIYVSDLGEALDVVITKDGYNTFKKSYVVTSNTVVKITLAPSGGDYFLDLDLGGDNPFYDPEGLFNVMPTWVAVSATLFFIAGICLILKKEKV